MTPLVRVLVVTLMLFDACVDVTPDPGHLAYTTGASVDTEIVREDDAKLRNQIKHRSVVKEKVAPRDAKTKRVELTVEFSVLAVLSADDATRVLKTAIFLELSWQDPYLTWNSSQYSGVRYIELPTEAIWIPDLRVLNTFTQTPLLDGAHSVVLTAEGDVSTCLFVILDTCCVMDLTRYPYDHQKCNVTFFSFTPYLNVSSSGDVKNASEVKSKLNLGNEWDLVRAEVLLYQFDKDDGHFPNLQLTLRRKTTFYTVCLVMPMVVTSYMNTLVFLLPLQAGEKVSFLISIFVSTSVFVSYFTSVMPRGLNDLPNLMILLVGVIVQSLLILIATVVVLRLHHRQQGPDDHPDDGDDVVVMHMSDVDQHRDDKETVGEDPGCHERSQLRDGRRVVKLCFCNGQVKSGWMAPSSGEGGVTSGRSKGSGAAVARRLDHAFFALAFVANSTFLVYLFYDLMILED